MNGDSGWDPQLAVEARDVRKDYRLGELVALRRSLKKMLRRRVEGPDRIEALGGVSFSVGYGECVALLGSNGSGKSTMLQIISGITVPSGGELAVRGRVLPLLEVGSSFHPELTGRENIVLFGTVLGMSRRDINEATPKVAAFAEIEKHLDTPVKRYSQGMEARLAFAIAMRFPASVYIFDEVLAVVDDSFRERCIGEIERLVAAGRAVIFVSHDLDLVRELCSRGIWLDSGAVKDAGPIDALADRYAASQHAHAIEAQS